MCMRGLSHLTVDPRIVFETEGELLPLLPRLRTVHPAGISRGVCGVSDGPCRGDGIREGHTPWRGGFRSTHLRDEEQLQGRKARGCCRCYHA